MSIFKTKGIVIKKEKLKENEFIYTIFTYDYGKIKAIKKESKKEKLIDLGNIINFEIFITKDNSLIKIRNIKISWQFIAENKSFSEINYFLELINTILKNTPEKVSIYEIFNTFEILKSIKNLDEIKLILIKLKILNILGILGVENKNLTINKILKFIDNNNIKNIIKLTGINDDLKEELEKIR